METREAHAQLEGQAPPEHPSPPTKPGATLQVLDMVCVREKAITEAMWQVIFKAINRVPEEFARRDPLPIPPNLQGKQTRLGIRLVPRSKPEDFYDVPYVQGVPDQVVISWAYNTGQTKYPAKFKTEEFWGFCEQFGRIYTLSPVAEVPECIRHLETVVPRRSE